MTNPLSRAARSLTSRLVITFLGVSAAIVLVVATVAYRQARGALEEQVLERLRTIAGSRERQFNRWVDGQIVEVKFLAGLPRLRQELPQLVGERGIAARNETRAALTVSFERNKSQKGQFSEAFVLSVPGGQVLVSTDSSRIGDYRVTDAYYVQGQKGTFVQNVYPSAAAPEGTPTLTISTPLRDAQGRVRAVLAAHLNLEQIDSIFSGRSGLGVTGEAYLTDRFHVFVSSTRFGRPDYPRGVGTLGVTRAADKHESGAATYLDYRGIRVLGVYRWLATRDLALLVEMDTREAFAPASKLLSTMILVGALSALALTVLVVGAARRIARPVAAIAESAARVAAGDFTAVARIETRDEVGRLAVAFNKMTHRLRRLYEDQQQHSAALEQSKGLLQAIIDSSTAFIVVTDFKGLILLANRTFSEVVARDGDCVVGRPILEVFPLLDPARRSSELSEVLSSGQPVVREESFMVRGVSRTMLLSRFLLRELDGAPYAFCAIATEITQLKQSEEERRRFSEQLQHTQKLESLGVLAGGIAHDFNNLLTSILGHASLALDEMPEDSRSTDDVERIVHTAQRAAGMTKQMLAYAGRGTFVLAAVDLASLVTEMSQLLQVSIPKKVELRYEMPPEPSTVEGDPAQLQQVVMNLITNAAEAIGDHVGTITLQIETVHLEAGKPPGGGHVDALPAGAYVRLVVADTGSGMERATLDRIFEPFFTTKFTGRGLGLAAVQGIMKSHRGTLTVDSIVDQGTRFSVYFPAFAGVAPAVEAAPVASLPRNRCGTVLIVDDEESIRVFARRALERAGYRVLDASDGAFAMEQFRDNPGAIGAVLLDMTMPVMDGPQVLRKLRAIDPNVRVILSSGFSEHDLAARGEAGDEHFLQKPYLVGALLNSVRDAMAG